MLVRLPLMMMITWLLVVEVTLMLWNWMEMFILIADQRRQLNKEMVMMTMMHGDQILTSL
jgi:hypothetical protein